MLYPPGHPRNPLSPQELEEKFFYWSTRVISQTQSTELQAMIVDLHLLTDATELGALLRI